MDAEEESGKPTRPPEPRKPQSEREKRLAEALRANLRRRKASEAPKPE
jgi:hypothetical protein